MSRTILASCLLFAIRAMIKTTTSEVCQILVFIRHCVLMKMMATIQLNHLTDRSFLSLYPGHICLFFHVTINESHFLGFLLVHQEIDGLALIAEFTLRVSDLRTDICQIPYLF